MPRDLDHVLRCATAALALTPLLIGQTLVADINTQPVAFAPSSRPRPVAVAQNGHALLLVDMPGFGIELWASDGTGPGTTLLRDILAGPGSSNPGDFAALASGIVLFRAKSATHGAELWRTDGTAAGTFMVRDLRPGPSDSTPWRMHSVGNEVVFFANDGVHGFEPWRSDGTAAGTSLLADVVPGSAPGAPQPGFARIGASEIVFLTANTNGQLWKADLSSGTTTLLTTLSGTPLSGLPTFYELGNRVLIVLRQNVITQVMWTTDGSTTGTGMLTTNLAAGRLVVAGARAFYTASDGELWTSDGTAAGTTLAVDVTPSPSIRSQAKVVGRVGNEVVFAAGRSSGARLFVSDGTPAGTRSLTTIHVPSLVEHVTIGGTLFFSGNTRDAPGLMCTDGTVAGTRVLSHIGPHSLLDHNGVALFGGQDPAVGDELWGSDGTPAGTRLIADIRRMHLTHGSSPRMLGTIGGRALFAAFDGDSRKVWQTDGTAPATRRFAEPEIVPTSPASFASTGAFALLLLDQPGVGQTAWIHRPGAPTLQPLVPAPTVPGFRPDIHHAPVALGDRIVFGAFSNAAGVEPWITDGTEAGTTPIADIEPGSLPGTFGDYVTWRARTYFRGRNATVGTEPWVTDGTAAGTAMLIDTAPGGSGLVELEWQPTDERLFFRVRDAQGVDELWSTDGLAPGATAVGLSALGLGEVTRMTSLGDRLLFVSSDGSQPRAVVTDGTGAGTLMLPSAIVPYRIAAFAPGLAVITSFTSTGEQLWRTDGTLAGTVSTGQLQGRLWEDDHRWRVTDDLLLTQRTDAVLGRELHVSDGTAAGTHALFDLAPGDASPKSVVRLGDRVLFAADDGEHGAELFSFGVALLQDEVAEPFGFGCAAAGAQPPTLRVDGEADASAGSFDLVVDGAISNTRVLFAVSDTAGTTATGGCTAWLGGTPTVVATTSDAGGRAVVTLPVTPALFGLRFVAQAFAIEPNGPLLGLATATRGLEIVLGP